MGPEPAFLALVGPSRCRVCGHRGGFVCDRCLRVLRRPQSRDPVEGADRLVAAWEYEAAARDLLLSLKLRGRREAASLMAAALEAEVRRHGLGAEVITWVPARRRDARTRGFDHAELIARPLAARLGLPARRLLERVGPSRPDQASLTGAQRKTNLKGAFVARRNLAPVCLVDDLLTTGATAASCAVALRRSGATSVELAVACRSS